MMELPVENTKPMSSATFIANAESLRAAGLDPDLIELDAKSVADVNKLKEYYTDFKDQRFYAYVNIIGMSLLALFGIASLRGFILGFTSPALSLLLNLATTIALVWLLRVLVLKLRKTHRVYQPLIKTFRREIQYRL